MSSTEDNSRRVIREAARWLMRLNSGSATEADRAACARWREQSDAHRHAWDVAQQLKQQLDAVPDGMSHALRDDPGVSTGRRRTVKALSWLAVAAPAGWLASRMPWQEWNAGYKTATGEQRDIRLADGSQITLNTGSAVDVVFDSTARRILLRAGEIMVLPAADNQRTQPALQVSTSEGIVEARGKQFSVRQQQGLTRVVAFRGGVQVSPAAGMALRLEEGQCCTFTREAAGAPQAVNEQEALWARGLLYANNMRLKDLIAELSRYRRGVLRCADDIADLRVSGIYQLKDTDATLALLQRTYPVRVMSLTPYWTTVESRTGVDSAGRGDRLSPSRPETHDT